MSTKRTCPAVLVVKGSAAGPLKGFSSRNNFLVPITTETKDFLPKPMYYLFGTDLRSWEAGIELYWEIGQ